MRFIETPIFTEDVSQELPPEDYRQLQLALMLRPEQGPVIVGSGGLRKLRWRRVGTGKRGGLRVIYYWEATSETFYMLAVYRKSARDDLSAAQVRLLRRLVAQEFK